MTAVIPRILITGRAPGLPLSFVVAGEMASQFEEAYSVDIEAKNKAASDSGQPGQTPHPKNMNFDKGQFENTSWQVKLFSGVIVNNKQLHTGAQLVAVAQTLYRLSMPRSSGKDFIGPPLVHVQYSSFWRAKGLFQKVTFTSEGAFDRKGYPTLLTLRMEFARHFGGGAERSGGGVYKHAEFKDLQAATAQRFVFKMRT